MESPDFKIFVFPAFCHARNRFAIAVADDQTFVQVTCDVVFRHAFNFMRVERLHFVAITTYQLLFCCQFNACWRCCQCGIPCQRADCCKNACGNQAFFRDVVHYLAPVLLSSPGQLTARRTPFPGDLCLPEQRPLPPFRVYHVNVPSDCSAGSTHYSMFLYVIVFQCQHILRIFTGKTSYPGLHQAHAACYRQPSGFAPSIYRRHRCDRKRC